jgi:two-component system phosphate regulon sensor histidine kinase PhoR
MPRTRLVWHLFAGWSLLVVALVAACLSVGSVQLAKVAADAQRQRLVDCGRGLSGLLDGADAEHPVSPDSLVGFAAPVGIELEVLAADGRVVAGAARMADRGLLDAAILAEAKQGRIGSGTWYDDATGRHWMVVAVPRGPTGKAPDTIILLAADTSAPDRSLRQAQATLALGTLAGAAAAIAVGWIIARRAARPIERLHAAADRIVAGEIDGRLPTSHLAEVAGLAAAFGRLRDQLVERGLTIGRQGTQQEAVLGSMIEGVLAIDARQRIVGLNRAAAELLDVELDDVLRRPLQEVVRNPDLRRFALLAIDCREPVEDDLVLHGPRERTIRLRGTALRDVSGEGGAVIVLNDVTDIERLETVRRDFVANVSHELKTPVASIKGFVETLLDGAVDDPTDARRFLEIVARQADRLASIIEDLLALSRIEQSEGVGNLPLEPTRIGDVFAAVLADCEPRAIERAISLETRCDECLTAEVNPPLLEQAVINLVDNAIKYSDPGDTVRLEADIEPAKDGHDLVIRVADDGAGIAAEHLPRLFERFYRADKARSRKLGGTGLGLAIVKHIVQAHGGTVAVESTPGVGSVFTIRLPTGG